MGMPGRSCQSVDEALTAIEQLAAADANYEIYYCISVQKLPGGERKQKYALYITCLPVDSDIRPGSPDHYQTRKEAVIALWQACIKLGIPKPSIIVYSGGGLHAYWLSNRPLPIPEWQPYANALKRSLKAVGFKFDPGCTGDAARVLRVPGTNNHKYPNGPRLVRCMSQGSNELHDFSNIFAKLLTAKPDGNRSTKFADVKVAEEFKSIPLLPDDTVIGEMPPLPVDPILQGCGWLREAHETGGAKFDNPQWNLTTLISTFLENGHDLAHAFGNKHPDYNPDATNGEWDRKNRERRASNIGWPRCQTIALTGSTHCAGCPHFPGVEPPLSKRSPIHLGFEAFIDAQVDEEIKEAGGTRPQEYRLPQGFFLDQKSRVSTHLPGKKLKNGIQLPSRPLALLLRKIGPPSLQHKDGYYGVGFIAHTDRTHTVEVFLHTGNCRAKTGLIKYLGDKGLLVSADEEAEKMLEKFAVSWLELLMTEDEAIRDPGTMGWRYEGDDPISFVYGNVLYHEDGTDRPLVASADSEFRNWYKPTGKREAWVAAAKLLTDRKRPELDIIISIGFAAPLMTFAGTQYGTILSVWGDPGTSKSTAQQVAASVWGHPKQTRESLNSTPKSVQRRLGLCRNLAAYWDDIQDERHQDALFQTMFVATQGAEGGRLNQDSTMKERLEWQTLLVACSNASFVAYLTNKQKSTTAGMRRVFEIKFNKLVGVPEPGMVDPTDASKIFSALERNYGIIGVEYARILAKEHVAIAELVDGSIKSFRAKIKGEGDENYWWGTCGVLLAGARLANRLGAEIDIEAMEAFLLRAFEYNRTIRKQEGTEGGTYENTERALVEFLNFYVGKGHLIVIDRLSRHWRDEVNVYHDPLKGCPIVVQIVAKDRKIIFSKRELREYLKRKEIQSRQITDGLVTYFKAVEARHTLGASTKFSGGQEWCFEIEVPADRPHVLLYMFEAHLKSAK